MRGNSGKNLTSHSVSGLFVFLLLGAFALFGTAMVLMGVRAYRQTAERSGMHNTARIISSYLRSMVRADDEAQAVRVEEKDGLQVIALVNTYDEEQYVTRIYVWNGSLRESFTEAEEPFEPERGDEVCPAGDMTAALSGHLLVVRVLAEGAWNEVDIALHSDVFEDGILP